MSGSQPPAPPEVTALMLATFADLYRQEAGAEEDVHRTLPFFGTALGIVIGALAYAAGRLPKWSDLTTQRGHVAFAFAAVLLALAIIEAACVLVFMSPAIVGRRYRRIGPETALRARLAELQAFYEGRGITGDALDKELVRDMRQVLLDDYAAVTPTNRALTEWRYRLRARAASHLIRSLIWALAATTVMFMTDKLSYLPHVIP
jgi:hypothetical protein